MINEGITAILAIVSAAILLCVLGMFLAVQRENELRDSITADHCELISKEETKNKVYCGKTCLRPELRKEYSCKSGIKIIVE